MPTRKKLPTGVVQHGDKFRYRITIDGKRRNSSCFGTPEQAALARSEATGLAKARPAKRATLQDGFDRVIDRGGIRPGTLEFYQDVFAKIVKIIPADTGLLAIAEPKLLAFLKRRENETGIPTIVKELVMLGRIFNVCVEDGLVETNPVRPFRAKYRNRLKTRKKDPRWVSLGEFEEVFARMAEWAPVKRHANRCGDLAVDVLVPQILFCTGLRRAELGRLKVKDIDLADGVIYPEGKCSDATVAIPKRLRPYLVAHLKTLKPNEFIVPQRKGDRDGAAVRRVFQRWQQRLQIDWTPHALRHGLGSLLAAQGANTKTIMRALRHETPEMSLHYQSMTDESVRNAVDDALAG